MPAGRPSSFTPEIADAICTRLAEGQSLREICSDEGMPNKATVMRWLAANEAFRDQYARARADQADHFAEEILEIADDGKNDWMERETQRGRIETVPDHEHINRSKLRVDARRWLMSKMAPKKYGDKIDVEHTGKDGGPIETETKVVQIPLKDIAEAPVVKPLIRDDDDRPSVNGSGLTH